MTVPWCRACGRFHLFVRRCTQPPARCLHEQCKPYNTCRVIEMEAS